MVIACLKGIHVSDMLLFARMIAIALSFLILPYAACKLGRRIDIVSALPRSRARH